MTWRGTGQSLVFELERYSVTVSKDERETAGTKHFLLKSQEEFVFFCTRRGRFILLLFFCLIFWGILLKVSAVVLRWTHWQINPQFDYSIQDASHCWKLNRKPYRRGCWVLFFFFCRNHSISWSDFLFFFWFLHISCFTFCCSSSLCAVDIFLFPLQDVSCQQNSAVFRLIPLRCLRQTLT